MLNSQDDSWICSGVLWWYQRTVTIHQHDVQEDTGVDIVLTLIEMGLQLVQNAVYWDNAQIISEAK
jgi:hypothetical protein